MSSALAAANVWPPPLSPLTAPRIFATYPRIRLSRSALSASGGLVGAVFPFLSVDDLFQGEDGVDASLASELLIRSELDQLFKRARAEHWMQLQQRYAFFIEEY